MLRTATLRILCAIAGGICMTAIADRATAGEPSIYMVEENWEMVVREPDGLINSPQVTFFLFPHSLAEGCYFQLQMNYAAEDGYSSGGFRVSAVCQETPVDEERSQVRQTLVTDGDRLEWTAAMAVFDGKLMFAVKDGTSIDWGSFGGPEYLVEMGNNGLTDLSGYTPDASTSNVDIGFGRNRVASIRLKSVRVTYTDGRVEVHHVNQIVVSPSDN